MAKSKLHAVFVHFNVPVLEFMESLWAIYNVQFVALGLQPDGPKCAFAILKKFIFFLIFIYLFCVLKIFVSVCAKKEKCGQKFVYFWIKKTPVI